MMMDEKSERPAGSLFKLKNANLGEYPTKKYTVKGVVPVDDAWILERRRIIFDCE